MSHDEHPAGTWQRSGRNIVIDFSSASPSAAEALEYDIPPISTRSVAPPRLSLADALKQLRAFLKDAKSLKANAKLEPTSAPMTAAFQAALNKAKCSPSRTRTRSRRTPRRPPALTPTTVPPLLTELAEAKLLPGSTGRSMIERL
jgi:hypothetical protein